MRTDRLGLALLLTILLAGCATVPDDFEQVPSQAWQQPASTFMGGFFDSAVAEQHGHSGVRLLSNGNEAFIARYALAGQAEKTLDLQYYLWKGDTTGQALLHRVFQAEQAFVPAEVAQHPWKGAPEARMWMGVVRQTVGADHGWRES